MTSPLLPPVENIIQKAYKRLRQDIDDLSEALVNKRFKTSLKCGPGCSECCMRFSILPLEAALIMERLKNDPPAKPKDHSSCSLLHNNLCSIYDIRPLICRTQGLPLGYVDEDSGCIEVSACRLNFADDYQFSHEDLFLMDQFNLSLAELNMQYCSAAKLDPQQRIAIAGLV